MVHKELLDWIHDNKNKGYKAHHIHKAMTDNGYSKKEANKAIKIAFSNESEKLFFHIAGIIIALAIIVAILYFFILPREPIKIEFKNSNSSDELSFNNSNYWILDCSENIDCFIDAARNCSQASWTSDYGVELEIKGMKSGNCYVYRPFLEEYCPYETSELLDILQNIRLDRWNESYFEVCS